MRISVKQCESCKVKGQVIKYWQLLSGAKLFIFEAVSSGDAVSFSLHSEEFYYTSTQLWCMLACSRSAVSASADLYVWLGGFIRIQNTIIPWQYLLSLHWKILTEIFHCKCGSKWIGLLYSGAGLHFDFPHTLPSGKKRAIVGKNGKIQAH